jgi:hypothetical protein
MPSTERALRLEVLSEVGLGSPIGQLRGLPVSLGAGAPRAFLVAYCADFDDDPYIEMFFFPTDTLKLALITERGEIVWRRDLGRAVVPGVWFCPIFAFDLDGDGVDEIWYVNNVNTQHPLGLSGYRLERLDAQTGATTGQWPWPNSGDTQTLSFTFRHFILGGHVGGEPVLITGCGTYGDILLCGWRADMSLRWENQLKRLGISGIGAAGSHMCAIADFDQDGAQEVLWGERRIELDTGRELFCADRTSYRGHSDIVQPVLDRATGRWCIYTCRESDPAAAPRVALFDAQGERTWGHVEHGHMDMGWVAQFERPIAMAIRIGAKTCGPDGRFHFDRDEFVFDALTGEPQPLPFSVYGTLPVDLDGDGHHELVRGIPGLDGAVLDRKGNVVGSVGGPVAMLSKFVDHAGEQLLAYYPDGTVRVWADRNAEDSVVAQARYGHPLYRANQRLTGVGYNLVNLGGV